MKHLLLVLILITVTVRAAEPVKRLHAIEMKFGINYDHAEQKLWVFSFPVGTFGKVPIVIPVNATDHDVMVALQASLNCAIFYEKRINADGQKSSNSVLYAF